MPNDAAPGTEQWHFETGADIRSSPTVYDGSVYIGSTDGTVSAVDADSGTEQWTFETNGPVHSSPTVFGATVYIGSDDGSVYALDRKTGTKRWQYETGGRIRGTPVIFNLTLYVGSADGTLYALDPGEQTPVWTVDTDGGIVSAPVVAENTVFVGSTDGTVTAIAASGGEVQWRFETEDEVRVSPTASERVVYVGDRSGSVYALTHAEGEEIGRLEGTAPESGLGGTTAVSPPTAVGRVVVFGNYRGRVYAARIQSEMQGTLWKHEGLLAIESAPAIANDRVYVGDVGQVSAVDLTSGEQLWRFNPEEAAHFRSSPIVSDGTLYIGNDNGNLYAVTLAETRASRDSRTELGTLGHHDRRAFFQSSTGIHKYIEADDDPDLERAKRLNESMDITLWTEPE